MATRTIRTTFYHKKRKLSKYESALEDAFRESDTRTTDGTAVTYSTVPQTVIIPDGDQTSTEVTLPDAASHPDKQVTVVNRDAAESVDVGGVTCGSGETTVVFSNGTAWAKLYAVTNV